MIKRDVILQGDVLEVLRTLPSESIDCVVTSPPYWGLRDYGVAGQFGLEKTPEEFVEKMVVIFREIKRVLKKNGTVWLNLGDSYAAGSNVDHGVKPKDLVGIPWMVAFALRADGWYLRQDIIWSKSNPMPESVQDRCTKSHEYVFLLSRSEKYHCDMKAIREPAVWGIENRYARIKDGHKSIPTLERNGMRKRVAPPVSGWGRGDEPRSAVGFNVPGVSRKTRPSQPKGSFNGKTGEMAFRKTGEFRNKRSVWNISSHPFKKAHFATFPEKLIEPMILAGCPQGGVCLDPFMGAGTTAVVSKKLGRNYLGIELNPAYIEIAEERLKGIQLPLSPGILETENTIKIKDI